MTALPAGYVAVQAEFDQGAWVPLVDVDGKLSVLIAGPDVVELPHPDGTVVLPAGRTLPSVKLIGPGSDEIVIRAAGAIDVPAGATPDIPPVVAAGASNADLRAWTLAESYSATSVTRDSNEAIVTAIVSWPDGATGVFTTDTASTVFPGAIDAYHITYQLTGHADRTVTQPLITRNGAGTVAAQPTLVVS
jgi:hypothetical protein